MFKRLTVNILLNHVTLTLQAVNQAQHNVFIGDMGFRMGEFGMDCGNNLFFSGQTFLFPKPPYLSFYTV